MREFMDQQGELFGFRPAGQQSNPSAVAHAHGRGNRLLPLRCNPLGYGEVDLACTNEVRSLGKTACAAQSGQSPLATLDYRFRVLQERVL